MNSIKNASGATVRIAGFSGTVTITDASSKEVKPSVNLLLHAGYTIATAKGAEVFISLDGKNVIKLAESGKVTCEKSGNDLKVTLSSGSLYAGLEATELSKVQTSTMATGVRG